MIKELIGKIGIDRVVIEVGIKSINTSKMGNGLYSIGYAAEDDNLCVLVNDISDNNERRIKNMKMMYTVDGATEGLKEKDTVKYGIEVKQRKNNLNGAISTVATLDIVMGRVAYDTVHNIYNVHTTETAQQTIQKVKRELAANGINLTDESEWIVTSVEVNKTMETEKSLSEYTTSLEWAFNHLLNSRDISEDRRHRKKVGEKKSITYGWRSKRRDIKFYDKAAQCRELNIHLLEELSRCEIKWDKEGIERAFGSNSIEILYNREKIESAYNRAIADMVKTLKKAADKEIEELYQQFKGANYKEMNRVFSNNSKGLFDIVFLLEAANRSYKAKKQTSSNFNRDTKKLLKELDTSYRYNYRDLMYLLTAFSSEPIEVVQFSKAVNKYNV